MATVMRHQPAVSEDGEYQKVAELLGLRRRLKTPLDVHEVLVHGLPGAALAHLVGKLVTIQAASIEKAMGMSVRTFQRRKGAPAKLLSQEQSGRAWQFAEILAKATAVLGSQDEAEQWLARPAIGLDQRRPIDLLATPTGARLVEDYLLRLEYGVYA